MQAFLTRRNLVFWGLFTAALLYTIWQLAWGVGIHSVTGETTEPSAYLVIFLPIVLFLIFGAPRYIAARSDKTFEEASAASGARRYYGGSSRSSGSNSTFIFTDYGSNDCGSGGSDSSSCD